jgi:2-polyprenyl-6-methoxyphenol hydroxylase-like FAD-dependent oxidoreductase
MLKFV